MLTYRQSKVGAPVLPGAHGKTGADKPEIEQRPEPA